MPNLYIEGVDKHGKECGFFKEGVCLAVLGKTENRVNYLAEKIEESEMESIKTVTYYDIYTRNSFSEEGYPRIVNSDLAPIVEKYLSLFPFSRTIVSSIEDLLSGKGMKFNVEDYTLNEVMFAMFHVRALTYSNRSNLLFEKCVLEVLYEATQQGIPFWKAYLIAVYPQRSNASKWCDYDGNIYNYYRIPVKNMFKLLRGQAKMRYRGWTLMEHVKKGKSYLQNITTFLTEVALPHKALMSSFYKQLKEGCSPAVEEYTDCWGETSRTETYDILDAVNSLDKLVKKRRIKTGSLLC